MSLYLLNTSIASYIITGLYPAVRKHLVRVPMECVCVSSITEAELA